MGQTMKHQNDRELVARDVRPDNRQRVSPGAALKDLSDATFDVYRDGRGNIILEPQVTIPTSEVWLFRNRNALESVARGLEELARGETTVRDAKPLRITRIAKSSDRR